MRDCQAGDSSVEGHGGEYEDLENEWKIICKKIGIDHYELPIYNSSKHNDFRTYYTEETKDIVYEYFKEDFWYLGYHRND